MEKDELNHRIRNYNPDVELEGSGHIDYGHNLADAVMNSYNSRVEKAHGNIVEENKIRMEIQRIGNVERLKKGLSKRDFHLNNILTRLDISISKNNN